MMNENEADPELIDVIVDESTHAMLYVDRLTSTPTSEFALLYGVSTDSLDSDGLIIPGPLEVLWYNEGANQDNIAYATTGVNPFDTALNDLGDEAIGICSYEVQGAGEWTGRSTGTFENHEMFRNVAAVQNFSAEDPKLATPTPTYNTAGDSWNVEYAPQEVQGLIDRFGGLSGTTVADVISEKMRSLAIEVLQTFPSRELHFSKVKSLVLKTTNLAAFAVSEGNQNITLSLERMGADYGSSA